MTSPAEVCSDLTRYRLAGKKEQHSFNWCHHIVYGDVLASCLKMVSTCCTKNVPYPDFIHSALTTLHGDSSAYRRERKCGWDPNKKIKTITIKKIL